MTTETMSTKELAEYLGVTKQTLFRWRQDGYGPAWMQVGLRTIRYKLSDIKEWEDRIRNE
jgi:excisionase family DNA binding protein